MYIFPLYRCLSFYKYSHILLCPVSRQSRSITRIQRSFPVRGKHSWRLASSASRGVWQWRGVARGESWGPDREALKTTFDPPGLRFSTLKQTLTWIPDGSYVLCISDLQGKHDWLSSGSGYKNIDAVLFIWRMRHMSTFLFLAQTSWHFLAGVKAAAFKEAMHTSLKWQLPSSPVCKKADSWQISL